MSLGQLCNISSCPGAMDGATCPQLAVSLSAPGTGIQGPALLMEDWDANQTSTPGAGGVLRAAVCNRQSRKAAVLPQARNPTRAVSELLQGKRFPFLPRAALPTDLTLCSSSRRSS